MLQKFRTLGGGLLVLLLLYAPAHAHTPFFYCALVDENEIECEGGFSDGSSAAGVKVELLSAEDEVLVSTRLGRLSTVTFNLPEGDFYLLMDAGPGHVIEVDRKDIKGLKP